MLGADTDHVARELYCFGNFKVLAVTLLFFLKNVTYLFDIVLVISSLMRQNLMKNFSTSSALALLLISLSGCASYNSVAPEWAQIGAKNSETTADESKAESNSDEESSSWWNPLSWF